MESGERTDAAAHRGELQRAGIAAAAVFAVGALGLGVLSGTGSPLLALGLLGGLSGGVGWASRGWMGRARPVDRLGPVLDALAAGDAEVHFSAPPGDPLAPLARPVARIAENLLESRRRLGHLAARVDELPDQLASAIADAERSAEDQEAAVEETASLLANINTSIRGINAEVDRLARSNEETAASIQEMGTAIEQVASTATSLQETVESSTASIQQMSVSIRRVAESSEEVQQVADETATATTEMDRAIQEVGDHVRGASDLTGKVSERAEEGSQAVGATIHGIETIRDQTLQAKSALEALAVRIGEIGEIATVIGGISDETNLLSLNAAIIAAQAGEHGKAFAVVAGQVKTLSRRTSSSAKQIEEMIRAVQSESANAVRAMGEGIQAVEDGVARSRVAGEALEVIRASASEASGQVKEIARATEEQARNSKHVATATQRVSEYVQQISHAMSEQTTASDTLARNVNIYLDMARQMAQATEEQRATSRYITNNSQSITELIRSIQSNTANHETASRAVAERFESLLDHAHKAAAQIPHITEVVERVRREAAGRREEESDPA